MDGPTPSDRPGGTELLSPDLLSDFDWIEALKNGFPSGTVDAAIEGGLLSRAESEDLVIPRRTLQHRRAKDQMLSLYESDRLLRIARETAQAEKVFADQQKAKRWLRKPSRPLNGAIPLELLTTSAGTDMVREELIRIEHGIYL